MVLVRYQFFSFLCGDFHCPKEHVCESRIHSANRARSSMRSTGRADLASAGARGDATALPPVLTLFNAVGFVTLFFADEAKRSQRKSRHLGSAGLSVAETVTRSNTVQGESVRQMELAGAACAGSTVLLAWTTAAHHRPPEEDGLGCKNLAEPAETAEVLGMLRNYMWCAEAGRGGGADVFRARRQLQD